MDVEASRNKRLQLVEQNTRRFGWWPSSSKVVPVRGHLGRFDLERWISSVGAQALQPPPRVS
uniref:Uncharacterized protein n=1 Tax=Cucumis melo TaxID=3656 RepID=A0A9I9EJK2_CUCME